jgi:hypothetical protein
VPYPEPIIGRFTNAEIPQSSAASPANATLAILAQCDILTLLPQSHPKAPDHISWAFKQPLADVSTALRHHLNSIFEFDMTAYARRRLLSIRAPRRTPQGRRIRCLFRSYVAKLDADNPLHQAAALRAAELTVAAEDVRASQLGGNSSAEEAVTRLENAARRAERDLIPLIPKPTTWWEQQQHEADDGEEA